jgi:hypothetical protein
VQPKFTDALSAGEFPKRENSLEQVFEWAGWTSVTLLFSRENGNTGPKYLLKPNLTLPQIRKREGRGENGRRSFPSADCAYIRFRPISRRIGRGPL